ncbi:MAG: hypothetical protein FJW40_01850 [Acidobacteria bacterium]|nr:hypothetical protein [Acidobacteriota bacterium]
MSQFGQLLLKFRAHFLLALDGLQQRGGLLEHAGLVLLFGPQIQQAERLADLLGGRGSLRRKFGSSRLRERLVGLSAPQASRGEA